MAMGGRAAEDILYGNDEVTTGCGSDLVNATRIGYEMARRFGMVNPTYLLSSGKNDLSDQTNYELDVDVQDYLKQAYAKSKEILLANKDKLDRLAKELAVKETLSKQEVKAIIGL